MREVGHAMQWRARRAIVAVIAVLAMIALGSGVFLSEQDGLGGEKAYASARIPSTVWYNHGHKVWYGGTGSGSNPGRATHTFHSLHDDLTEFAYCAIPSKDWIDNGDHPTTPLIGGSVQVKSIDEVAMVLYYGYGGPGFDKDMWPDKYYDGTDMDKENRYDTSAWYDKYYAMTHLLVSDRAFRDDNETLDQCSSSFTKWFAWHIQGNKHWATEYAGKDAANPNSVYNKMKAAWSGLSETFRTDYANSCYAINPHVWGDTGAQIFIVAAKYKPPFGALSLVKASANGLVTNGNACYSLQGAVYGVYESAEAASSHSADNALRTYTTDAAGSWTSEEDIEAGTYYVSEIQPSSGYRLDESVYTVKVKAGKTARVNGVGGSVEPPIDAPIELAIAKKDADLSRAASQGAASLQGAEFTFRYYAGYFDAAGLPSQPTRTWVLATDDAGTVSFQNAARLKVSGDDFYYNADGLVTLPLGTVSVVETKAPRGYNLERADGGRPKTYVFQVVPDQGSQGGASVRPLNYSNTTSSNTPVVGEVVKRGDFRLVKEVPVDIREDAPQEQKRILLPGVHFQIRNSNAHTVLSPQTGKEVPAGEVVCEIVTDENGLASTRSGASTNGWGIPSGWKGALVYGSYTVHEVIPDAVKRSFKEKHGTSLSAVPDWKITIADEGSYEAPTLVTNKIPQTPLSVAKVDSETGKRVPLPVSFQLFDASDNLVTYTSHYPKELTLDTWTANDEGELTLPMFLPGGKYTLKEVEAPEGYVLSSEGVTFTVDDYRSWDNPLTVEYQNTPIKGVIEIVKSDASTGKALAGAQYVIAAAADIVTPDGTVRKQEGETVAVVVTDAEGKARTPELYLGPYKVYEAKAPEGYALDTEEHIVTLVSEGQDVPVVTVGEELSDAPTTLRLLKRDAQTGDALSGATFRVWQDGEGGFDAEVKTSEDGIGELPYLAHGAYHVRETVPPARHHLDEEPFQVDFKVDDQGFVGVAGEGFSETLALTVDNEPNEIRTYASVDGDQMADASGTVKVVDKVAYKGCESGKSYVVKGVLHRLGRTEDGLRADGGALLGADGKPIEAQAEFTAENSEGSIEVTFEFDASALAGVGVVAFEKMYCEGELFAEHEDVNDDDQAVFFRPDAATVLVDGETGNHVARVARDTELIDTVSYRGLIAGKEYRLRGTLMDKEARKPLVDAEGKDITAELAFTPEAEQGDVQLTFKLDTSLLAGRQIVAFERVLDGEVETIVHEDYDDASQTVVLPTAKTSAADGKDGDSFVLPDGKASVVDTVTYTGLAVGQEYVVEGALHRIGKNNDGTKKDLGVLKDSSGKPVLSRTKFVPEAPDGKVEVTFKFDAHSLEGESSVAFEQVRQTIVNQQSDKQLKTVTVVEHADVNDEAQTVVFRAPTTKEVIMLKVTGMLPKTQDDLKVFILVVVGACAGVGAVVAFVVRRRKRPLHAR